ncbi:hypothetical protein AVEN_65628-1 [Araneus ventricosus]|uniref:Uncharacterized protein n=1 Tax=Araneus ventricosus TaxID=182803 RepID=A0A4Y2H2G9_ARAVE|nr:hypothetical protein AVEN_65628-1 [Araneus ventricosus]
MILCNHRDARLGGSGCCFDKWACTMGYLTVAGVLAVSDHAWQGKIIHPVPRTLEKFGIWRRGKFKGNLAICVRRVGSLGGETVSQEKKWRR